MSTDPCLDAALDLVKKINSAREFSRRLDLNVRQIQEATDDILREQSHSSIWRRVWNWYVRLTGWEKASSQRRTGLKIRSTVYPPTAAKPKIGSVIDQIMGGVR